MAPTALFRSPRGTDRSRVQPKSADPNDVLLQISKSQALLEKRLRSLQVDMRKTQTTLLKPKRGREWHTRLYDATIGHCIRGGGRGDSHYTALGGDDHERQTRLAEHNWEAAENRVFFPVGFYKGKWDTIILFLILYSAVMVPFRSCFHANPEGIVLDFEIMVTIFFLWDVILTFNTAYLEDERWVISRLQIAHRYLTGWFWIDAPASMPLELIEVLVSYGL